MANLAKSELLERFLESVAICGWQSIVSEPRQHPFLISLWSGIDALRVRLYIWNISPGGPSTVRPEGEYRIQITGVTSPLLTTPGIQSLLLGWEEDRKVFTAYDFRRHLTFGSSPSIQVRASTLERSVELGYAFQRRTNGEIIVALVQDQVVNYISKQADMHRVGVTEFEEDLLENLSQEDLSNTEGFDHIPSERQTTIAAVARFSRERTFRDRVLRAYSHQCSVCRLQLDLVQAAHIVPVKVPGSTDLTSNGLALCPNDHLAYDKGLLGVSPEYRILCNHSKLEELRMEGFQGGEETLLVKASNTIVLPGRASDRPNPDYLRRGMEVRGWPAT